MLDASRTYTSKNYGDFKVSEYINHKKVVIRFCDTGTVSTVRAGDVKRGSVKDRMRPTVYGVGFIGVGNHSSRLNGKSNGMYDVWVSMLQMCYDASCQKINPTYADCTVCDEWHNFQNFAEWARFNYIDGYHLDKDIKNKGNKIYSPEGCLFVSQKENTAFAFAKHYTLISPDGEVVNIYNMSRFCKGKGLTPSRMTAVHRGDERQHKGWKRASP